MNRLEISQYHSESQRELTPQQQTILWAQKTLEDYNSLPKGNNAERRKVKAFLENTADHLLQNPQQIDSSASVWKTRTSEQQGGFYEAIKQAASTRVKEKWAEIKPETLSEFIKVYANNVLAKDFAESLLSNYFKGPQNRGQRIDAIYKLAFSALDLIDKNKAFNEAIRIGLFDTVILPRDIYLVEFNVLSSLPYNIDDRTLQKLLIAVNGFLRLSFIASEDFEELRQRNWDYSRREKVIEANKKHEQAAIRKLGYDRAKQINDAMRAFVLKPGDLSLSLAQKQNVWPSNLGSDKNEPLNKKLEEVAGSKIDFEIQKKRVVDLCRVRGVKGNLVFIEVLSPDGFMIDVALPKELIGKRNSVIKYILNLNVPEEARDFSEGQKSYFVRKFEDVPIIIVFREAAGFESKRHPLQSLQEIGFPGFQKESGADVRQVNEQLADEIRATQIRFLNRRGVRVPLNGQLKELGYSHIDFHKDSGDPEKILVKIFVGETPYSVKLDKYLNFDFEGKRFNAPFIQDALKFTFLSLLKPILCLEKVKSPSGKEVDIDKEFTSRMPHLMLLEPGKHRSFQAIDYCQEFEHKDLLILDAEKRELMRQKGTPIPQDREYTYRRETIVERASNLPPITIHLPGVLQFN